MKKLSQKIICLLLSLCLISTYAHAIETRSSDYFNKTTASLNMQRGGKVDIYIDAVARRSMTELGASKIVLKESTDEGQTYSTVKTFKSEDYPDMLGDGKRYYGVAVTYDGVPGRMYKATIYFYASDSSGSDTITYTTSTGIAKN